MFKLIKKLKGINELVEAHSDVIVKDAYRRKALEDYLGIEFYQGDKQKPHYRKRKVVKKKLGRPRKLINSQSKQSDESNVS